MSDRMQLTWEQTNTRARGVAKEIISAIAPTPAGKSIKIYPVPRGGIPASLLVQCVLHSSGYPAILCEELMEADIIVDDIVDSGATRSRGFFRTFPFFALVDKIKENLLGTWVEFPWERMSGECGPQENIKRILEYIGEDPNREGLKETPDRVVKSYAEIFGGYKQDPASVLKVFEDDTCDEMVILRDIEFFSCCEHHIQPFFGKAHIAYIPKGRVVGISKLARLLEVFSRRLQIQERLCEQITEALMTHLDPKGAACVLEAQHFCMTCRGVGKQNSKMITSSLKGAFLEPVVRQEFFNLIRG